MYETVIITKVLSREQVEVACTNAACKGCKGSAFCNTKGKRFVAWNKQKLSLKEGSTVQIYLQPGRTIAGTLITLLLPLLCFPVAYFLAKFAGLGEGSSFLIAMGGILLGFLGVWWYFKHAEQQYLPVVQQVLSEESID